MNLRVGRTSRLLFGEVRTLDGVTFHDVLQLEVPPMQPDDLQHVWLATDRLPSVANTYYKDPTLWWVLALANDLERPPVGLTVGASIRIPSPRYVLETYLSAARGRVGT